MKARGFTLIELMIVVAIVAILSAVAYPSYVDYVRRGKIVDALASLSQHRTQMEQYFQDNRNYGTAGGTCPITLTISSSFAFTCSVGTPNTTYTVVAESSAGGVTPVAGDYRYTISESNSKSTTKFKGATVTKSCWLIRGSEC